jgi:DNA-binding NarL/FixJ family response regulator
LTHPPSRPRCAAGARGSLAFSRGDAAKGSLSRAGFPRLSGHSEERGKARRALSHPADVVLIDVSAGFDPEEVRAVVAEQPAVRLIAFGLREQRDDVIRCGRAGFAAYVPRDASLEILRGAMAAAVAGRLTCSPEIACSLLRELFRSPAVPPTEANNNDLTRREGDVLRLLGPVFPIRRSRATCASVWEQ